MGDLLERGSDWLEAQRNAHLVRSVVYARGEQQVSVLASIGRTVFKLPNEFGVFERHEARDYLVRTEDLVLDAAAVLPQRGDQVRETAGTKVYVYEVMAPGQEPEWRYSDLYRKALRIHTKLVGVEDVP
jgi:hypothetical protein